MSRTQALCLLERFNGGESPLRKKVKHIQGFSLLELMITLVVLGVLLGIGIPSFNSIIESTRLRSVTHSLNSATQFARSEALDTQNDTAVCRANGGFTACSFGADWSNGWAVFSLTDTGTDFETQADVTLVREWEAVDIVVSGAVNGFVFDGSGRALIWGMIQTQNGAGCRNLSVNASGSAAVQEVVCP